MSTRLPGSDGSRPASRNALLPSSDHRLNHKHGSSPKSPAPGYDACAMQRLLKPVVVVKAYPAPLSVKPRGLQPLMLLPRRHLQLSLLDLASPSGTFEFSRFYEAQVKILDLEARLRAEPKVLIARLDYDKTVYALERQETGLYTLCKLSSGVDLDLLSQDATVNCSLSANKRKPADPQEAESQPTITPGSHHESKKRRLAIEAIQSLVKKPNRTSLDAISVQNSVDLQTQQGESTLEQSQASFPDSPLAPSPRPASSVDVIGVSQGNATATQENPAQPDAESIFDNIRKQYQEALYHSRGSLAYFAKGPLSRARAAFHLDCDAKLEMTDLVEFLKGLVMTTVQIDKKYRETVPGIISKFKTALHDSAEEDAVSKMKKRKGKKMKLNKDGLYPDEDDHIRRWWDVRRPKPKDDETIMTASPQEARWETSYLRSRETQLQMIIILEILALQPLCSPDDNMESQQPSLPGDGGSIVEDASSQTVRKKRNRHNLPFLLDVHADRLTIWHSTALDEVNMINSTEGQKSTEGQDAPSATADPLKDFCVDIIVPFFTARLPDQCDAINRKLGGPVMKSPPKPRAKAKRADTTASKATVKADTTLKRTSSGHKSSLENVLSRESLRHRRSMSRGPGGVIALMRSVSTPVLPAMKREASEPATISKIPTAGDDDGAKSTGLPIMQGQKRKLGDDRSRKDANVQVELKNAISALRRPNREVVGQAMEEDAERRATTTLSQLKKSRKPQLHPRSHNVVKATPATSRFRDVLGRESVSQPTFASVPEDADTYLPPSSASLVPSSAPRKQRRSLAADQHPDELPPYTSRRERIRATPAKPLAAKPAYLAPPSQDEGCILASSPVMSRKIAQPRFLNEGHRTGLSHRDSGIEMPSSPAVGLLETPVKRSAPAPTMANFVTITPAKRSADSFLKRDSAAAVDGAGDGKKTNSIFARLGWDDEEDDLC